MKTARHLWPSVYTWDNLLFAAVEAARHRRFKPEVLLFNSRLEENLVTIQRRLVTGTWTPGPFRQFKVWEPKERLIHAPWYPDRVVHHALVQIVGPYFERRFIPDSYACRVGRGTHAASNHLTRMLQQAGKARNQVYVLKADVTKYFNSINHEILLHIVRRTVGDPDILRVFDAIVLKSGFEGCGLPLGALTSQLLANTYLDQLDHKIKDDWGIRHYVRYMDDFVILGDDKLALWRLLDDIRDFLAMELHLTLNKKTKVFPAGHGVDFAGYRHWADMRLPRKRNVRRATNKFKGLSRLYRQDRVELDTVRSVMASYVGYMKHCDGYRTCGSSLDKLVLCKGDPNELLIS